MWLLRGDGLCAYAGISTEQTSCSELEDFWEELDRCSFWSDSPSELVSDSEIASSSILLSGDDTRSDPNSTSVPGSGLQSSISLFCRDDLAKSSLSLSLSVSELPFI